MPTIRIRNCTSSNLNLALSHLCPIHFKNSVNPNETWTVHVGSVWFTFEARVDTTQNRYSVTKSAQTIGLVSLTGASIALVAVPLTLTGIAPFLGPATMAAELASHSLVVAGASSEVLQVTTWVAAALANKTIHQIATDRGVKEDQLEESLKNSNTIISSLKYFAISKSLVHVTKNIAASNRTEPSKKISATKDHGLLGLLGDGILNQGSKWWSQRFDSESKEPSADHQRGTSTQVHGVYIGFKTDYDFEWRDRLDDLGQWVGFELWNVNLDQAIK